MIAPLLDRIRELEKYNCRWKATSVVLATVLLSMISTGSVFFAIQRFQLRAEQQALRARDEAQMQEARARAAAAALEAQQKANQE